MDGEGLESLNCVYDFNNNTAEWDGYPEELDVCVGEFWKCQFVWVYYW